MTTAVDSTSARPTLRATALLIAVLALSAALAGCGGSSHKKAPSATGTPNAEAGAAPTAIDVPALVRKVEPSVVTILLPGGGVGTEVPASRRIVVATDRSPEASVLAARDALDEGLASR